MGTWVYSEGELFVSNMFRLAVSRNENMVVLIAGLKKNTEQIA